MSTTADYKYADLAAYDGLMNELQHLEQRMNAVTGCKITLIAYSAKENGTPQTWNSEGK